MEAKNIKNHVTEIVNAGLCLLEDDIIAIGAQQEQDFADLRGEVSEEIESRLEEVQNKMGEMGTEMEEIWDNITRTTSIQEEFAKLQEEVAGMRQEMW